MIHPTGELIPVICAALERGQRVRMTVNGSSMFPFLRDNDVVELEPTLVPRPGDVVLVRAAERYVLHRVVRIRSAAFFIRGDAQAHGVGPLTSDAILGRVAAVWRHGRARGPRRLAGMIWARTSPLGLILLQLALALRHLGGRLQRMPPVTEK